jgi:tetratricopeptide (TPR) repeat protein
MRRYMTLIRAALIAAVIGICVSGSALAQGSDAYLDFLLARHLEGEGDTAGALAALQRAAVSDPMSAEVRAEIASFQFRRNQRDEAQKAAEAALSLDGDNLEAHRVLGLVYSGNADNERTPPAQAAMYVRDAIVHLERVVGQAQGLTDLTVNFTLGRMYLRSGAADKAIQSLGRLVDQNPGSVQGRIALAQAHAANKDLKSAVATLDEIVDDEPRVAAALGQYQQQAGMNKEAVETYTKALELQPTSRELKVRRIVALYDDKDYARAAELSMEGQTQHPQDPRFARLQASALNASGNRTKAIEVLENLTRAFPKDTVSQFALVDIYSKVGRKADAERTLRQLLTVEPENANAMNYLGYLLAQRGDKLDEAIRLVNKALELEPENGAFLDSLGWAYFRKGDLNEAEKYLTMAAQKMPGNSDVQEHYGDVLAKRGRWSDAVAAWMRALEGDGTDIDRAAIEKKISNAKGRLPNAK